MAGKALKTIVAITFVVVVVGQLMMWRRIPEGHERNRIEAQIGIAAQALEDERVADVVSVISEDYDDPAGYSRGDLRRLARRLINKTDPGRFRVSLTDVTFGEEGATARLQIRLRSKRRMKSERVHPPPYPILTQWKKEDVGWRIVGSSKWQKYVSAQWVQEDLVAPQRDTDR